jgi:photosystem II stability/assembly factor-like uncharacterized protein
MKHSPVVGFIVLLVLISLLIPPLVARAKPAKDNAFNPLKTSDFYGLRFRNIGPALTSGRISDIAVHPHRRSVWYIAVGSGGVWKTVNSGTTWQPVFDSQTSYSIGCVTIDPNIPETIWVGTGENVSGRHVGYGDGIYKSLNGGKTWTNMGLKRSEHISKILVKPGDSNVIYVAAEGPLWAPGGERGVFKSIDGGKTWKSSLEISRDTGVTDLAFEPGNPNIVYAAAYQRRRSVAAFLGGGPESGIYKSTDAGGSWRKLSVGLPGGDMGRIGLAVSPIKPNVVYATIEASPGQRGFYRSENRGESWEKRNSYISGGTGPHYYQEIYADPHRFDRVYQMDVWMQVTDDGGTTFHKIGENHKHSDNHALAFVPEEPDYLLAGCDGGLYESWDLGKHWKFIDNLPVTQFYKMAVDNALPFYNVIGGAQDNGTQLGPSRTLAINGIMNYQWVFTYGADGYACAIDPTDENIIYASWQVGGLTRYDKKSGEVLNIQPVPGPGEEPPRWNWDSPLLVSPHSHTRLYYGSQRLYRSDDRGDNWTPISPDLTRGIFRYRQEIMGRTWSVNALWDHFAMSYYGSLTAVDESPLKEGVIYAGTDDGLIRITEDGGKNWRIGELPAGTPKYFFVNDIKASLHNDGTVFAAMDNHKTGDLKPYLVKSTDYGRTWTSITGDLPLRHIVWSIAQDHVRLELLFIGTEFGIFFTLDGGLHWTKFTGGMPTISFRDIEIQRRENDLVGASFGRGFFILDDYSPLRYVKTGKTGMDTVLFPVKRALSYVPSRPLELAGKGFQGDDFYLGANPEYGAVFSYYMPESLETAKERRLKKEKMQAKTGKGVAFPGWDVLRNEEREEKPSVVLTVRDAAGNVVRRLSGPVTRGLHRVTWDLRYPTMMPTRLTPPKDPAPWDKPPEGPMVVPGTFTVSIAKRVKGVLTEIAAPQSFKVESLGLQSLPAADKKQHLAFMEKNARLQRAVYGAYSALDDALKRILFIKKALSDTGSAKPGWSDTARKLEKRLLDIRIALAGDYTLMMRAEPYSPSIMSRIITEYSSSNITGTAQKNYRIAAAQFETLLESLRQVVDVELVNLENRMDAAGAPWTPGRRVPKWKKD